MRKKLKKKTLKFQIVIRLWKTKLTITLGR